MPATTAPDGARASRLADSAPELSPRSAEMIVASTSLSALPEEALAEAGLLLATAGFERLERDDLRELGELFTRVFRGLGAKDERWMSHYIEKLRTASLSAEESRRGRELLTQGVKALSPAQRARLQSLLEKAIAAGLRERGEAVQRAHDYIEHAPAVAAAAAQSRQAEEPAFASEAEMPAVPQPAPAAPAGAASSSSSSGASSSGTSRGEEYWRPRMQQARARVARLETQVRDLEARATNAAFGSAPETCVPSQRIRGTQDTQFEECAKRRQNAHLTDRNAHTQALSRLEQARADLAAAKRDLENLEEEARRAGALPGWLRE